MPSASAWSPKAIQVHGYGYGHGDVHVHVHGYGYGYGYGHGYGDVHVHVHGYGYGWRRVGSGNGGRFGTRSVRDWLVPPIWFHEDFHLGVMTHAGHTWLSRSDWCHPDRMPTPARSTANQMPYRPKRAALVLEAP